VKVASQTLTRCAKVAAIVVALPILGSVSSAAPLELPFIIVPNGFSGLIAQCTITRAHATKDCSSELTLKFPGRHHDDFDKDLNGHVLPGAQPGSDVFVLLKFDERNSSAPPTANDPSLEASRLEDAMSDAYPDQGLRARLNGQSSATCTIQDDGSLSDCWVTAVSPEDSGFDLATLEVARRVRLLAPLPNNRELSFDLAWHLPGPPEQAILQCSIGPDSKTRDCIFDDSDAFAFEAKSRFPDADEALLEHLRKQPLTLCCGVQDTTQTISVLRDELEKNAVGAASKSRQLGPYVPQRLTALDAEFVTYYYPEAAIRLEETGATVVRCKVTDDGRLNECLASGAGDSRLQHAHLRMTRDIHMKPPGPDAPPYDQRVYAFQVLWAIPKR
jgi:TonB family protein